MDYMYTNPAASFAEIINDGSVMASDGTVKAWCYDYKYAYESINDRSFRRLILQANGNTNRDNMGWITYHYNKQINQIVTTPTLEKVLTISEMLDYLK